MFRSVTNPYDEVIAKATDEKQTIENWDILLTVWDKVNEDGEVGARNCVAALQKRLTHRSANVQLFSLTVADALVNNCGSALHKEISGSAFTQTLVRLVNDRNTHEDVKKRIVKLVDGWVKENRKNPDFDLMVETNETLKAKHSKYTIEESTSPVRPSDEALRREEEELQRALAESAALADPKRSTGFQPSSSSSNSNGREDPNYTLRKSLPRQPSPERYNNGNSSGNNQQQQQQPIEDGTSLRSTSTKPPSKVRALYDFDTQTSEELPFRKGDIIKVIECVYSTWWRGELRGLTGIFPTVYVEEIQDPTPADLAQEAEMESSLFAQSASIDKLLYMMRNLDTTSKNVAENEELLELYQQSMALRPKVVKLIEKYNQKQAELSTINEKFTKAKSTYDHLIESSNQRYAPAPNQSNYSNQGGYNQNYPGYERSGSVVYSAPPQIQQQHQPPPQQQQIQQVQQQQQQQQHDSAGWSEQQKRDYDQQWAEYQRASQEYAQYYASQGLPVPQQESAPVPQQQQQHQQQAPVTSRPEELNAVPATSEPYYDGRNWIYPQQMQPQPQQSNLPIQQSQPIPQQQYVAPIIPATSQPQIQPQIQSQQAEAYWNGSAWIYPQQQQQQQIPEIHSNHLSSSTSQQTSPISNEQQPLQTEIVQQPYGNSPYPLAAAPIIEGMNNLSIEIPTQAISPPLPSAHSTHSQHQPQPQQFQQQQLPPLTTTNQFNPPSQPPPNALAQSQTSSIYNQPPQPVAQGFYAPPNGT